MGSQRKLGNQGNINLGVYRAIGLPGNKELMTLRSVGLRKEIEIQKTRLDRIDGVKQYVT